MSAAAALPMALLLAAGAIGVLRYSWGLPKRSAAANAGGWLLLAAAIAMLAEANGAWGIAVGLAAAMTAAAALLSWAALRSPARPGSSRAPRSGAVPAAAPLALGRRALWFLLTVPVAAAVSILWALAGQGLARAGEWPPADSGALPFLLMPLVWGVLAGGLLMASAPRRGVLWLVVTAAPAAALLLITL